MASFFKRKKSPAQLVTLVHRALQEVEAQAEQVQAAQEAAAEDGAASAAAPPTAVAAAVAAGETPGGGEDDGGAAEEIVKRLEQMKILLYGDSTTEPDGEKSLELARELTDERAVLLHLLRNLSLLPFEARKDTAQVFNCLVRKELRGFPAYVLSHFDDMVVPLVHGYEDAEIALHCGSMLREAIRSEDIARALLESDALWLFFTRYVHMASFDVASDAFSTLRELLMRNRSLSYAFIEQHYETVFEHYDRLLQSENYVTKRQSLKMLGELLLDRRNFSVMMRYISSKRNLRNIMLLLRDPSSHIQYEAFHVFKIFVANPKKPAEITRILLLNHEKLIKYLQGFHEDRDNPQFIDEKQLLIRTLQQLADTAKAEDNMPRPRATSEPPPPGTSGAAVAAAAAAGGGEAASAAAPAPEPAASSAASTATTESDASAAAAPAASSSASSSSSSTS